MYASVMVFRIIILDDKMNHIQLHVELGTHVIVLQLELE